MKFKTKIIAIYSLNSAKRWLSDPKLIYLKWPTYYLLIHHQTLRSAKCLETCCLSTMLVAAVLYIINGFLSWQCSKIKPEVKAWFTKKEP